jgi:hypothetical protein
MELLESACIDGVVQYAVGVAHTKKVGQSGNSTLSTGLNVGCVSLLA